MAFFRRFWVSLVGINDYQSLVDAGLSRAFGQICLLILILTIAYGIPAFDKTRSVLTYWAEEVVGWPDFRLADGRFQFSGEMPFITVQDDMAFIVDTEGEEGRALFEQYPEGILLTASQVYYKRPGTPAMPLNWSDLPFEISRDRLARGLPGWVWPITAVIVLFLLVKYLFYFSIFALIMGVIGLIGVGGRISYRTTLIASLYAMTGPILLWLLKDIASMLGLSDIFISIITKYHLPFGLHVRNIFFSRFPFFQIICTGWALAYLIIAVITMDRNSESAHTLDAVVGEEEREQVRLI